MSQLFRRVLLIVVLLCPAIIPAAWALDEAIHVAGDPRPAVLDLVDTSIRPLAVAVGPDGRHAVAAYTDPEKPNRSIVRIYATYRDEPLDGELASVVRSIVFSPDGLEAYVASYKPAKKRLGESQLTGFNVADGKSRTIMRIPPRTSSMDLWPARESLLLATLDELRTVRIAGMRSGPLYRVLGANLALTTLAGSTAVLIGQESELLLVDLDDPPGEDAMPVRARVPVPASVVTLAALPDASSALALLSDGGLYRVTFDPLAIERTGSALAVVSLGKQQNATTIAMAPLPVPAPEPPVAETPTAVEPPSPVETEQTRAEDAPEAVVAQAGIVERTITDPQTPPAPPAVPADEARQESSPPWNQADEPQLWGRLTGDAVEEVHEVLLVGPNSIVREAGRVRPDGQGFWRADGLEPGRYQIQLSSGGNKVLVSEPQIVLVEVEQSGSTEAKSFQVLRAFLR